MDDGAQYSAPQDALTLWRFHVDFAIPGNSSMTLASTIPVAPYDSVFPCSPGSRSCIPQPTTSNKIDILSYRQRPMWRLAYRNFGTHESLVTNQSVEAASNMAGIRWYEIRDPNGTPTIYQQGTYAPGVSDGIHRWMGSIAMDNSGNIALGYSASDATSTYPSSWYTGRLAGDPLGTLPQGEGSIINGTGSQTGSQRWGDYTSMNVDPVDDCTFWYVNEYLPSTSSNGWQLRIGAFRFDQCGTPNFTMSATPDTQDICVGAGAPYDVVLGSIQGYSDPVTLSAIGNPAGTTANFNINPVNPPGSSILTIGNTGAAAPGEYDIDIVGMGPTATHTTTVGLGVFSTSPETVILQTPLNGATNQPIRPTFTWSAADQGGSYEIEIATDSGFNNIVASATVTELTYTPGSDLNTSTMYYWCVRSSNICGVGGYSAMFSFTTAAAPGDCGPGTEPVLHLEEDFEDPVSGWTTGGPYGSTWALGPGVSPGGPHSGAFVFHADDVDSVTDQYLESPAVSLPEGESPLSLKFWNYQEIEDGGTGCYDGGVLEVTNNGGVDWTRLEDELMTDPYDGEVDSGFGNPLAGDNAWCGDPQNWLNSIVDIDVFAGQTVQFRWRLATDNSIAHPGWDVDDVVIQSCEITEFPSYLPILMDSSP
jgi:hypothetical protein